MKKYHILRTCLFFILLTIVAAEGSGNNESNGEKTTGSDTTKTKIERLEEKVKDMHKFEGLFLMYQDTTDGALFLEIQKEQIGKEFIYFVQSVDGIVDIGLNRGSYGGSRIFSIEKYFNRIELVSKNISYYFDPENALSRAKDANISSSIIASMKIIASDSLNKKFLLEGKDLFLTENLRQIKPSPPPGKEKNRRFNLGKLNKDKSKYVAVKNYPMNSDVIVQYVYDNP